MSARPTPVPSPPVISQGTTIGRRYRLEHPLGSGAQGWVWAAHDLALDVPVAVKLIRQDDDEGGFSGHRLFREARAAARLGHPAIVRVFDLGEAPDGSPYVAMERLHGETLAQRLRDGDRLSPQFAVRLLLPIADALCAAHAAGVVHRDVKPDNVFLVLDGVAIRPKLMDFGIARIVRGDPFGPGVTQSGTVVGTPSYISPEQARAHPDIDHRTDVWSFSVTLYECLSLCLPFEGRTWSQLQRAILNDEPPSLVASGACDEALWSILQKGLAKDPDARFPDMAALGRELAAWLLARGETNDVCGTALTARWLEEPAPTSDTARKRRAPNAAPRDPTLRSMTRTLVGTYAIPLQRRATFAIGSVIVTLVLALSVVSARPAPAPGTPSVVEARPASAHFTAVLLPWATTVAAPREPEVATSADVVPPPPHRIRGASPQRRASAKQPPFELIHPYATAADAPHARGTRDTRR